MPARTSTSNQASTKSAQSSCGTKPIPDKHEEPDKDEEKPNPAEEGQDEDTKPLADEFPWARRPKTAEQEGLVDNEADVGTWQGRKLKRSAKWLKEQAKSLNHLLRHYPTNRYCETCRRTKQTKVPAKKRRYLKRVPKCFGDEGTCDHFIANNEISKGIAGEMYGLTYRDRYTGQIEGMPLKTKSAK